MFFFDLFQKRLVNGTVQDAPRPSASSGKTCKAVTAAKPSAKEKSPANSVAETAKVPPKKSRSEEESVDKSVLIASSGLKEIISDPSGLGFRNYIANIYDSGCGVEDGCDERSLLVWSGYLLGIFEMLDGIRRTLSIDISLYTLGGGYARQFKHSEAFNFQRVCAELLKKPDFVLEISNSMGHLEVLRLFLFDVNDDGLAVVRSNRALVRKFPARQLNQIYFSRKEKWPVVDAVYTWVNHLDKGWQSLWSQEFSSETLDLDRYASNDEIRYSLRSLYKYAPWLRKIHIVSNCARPEWLAFHPKINWVEHADIFPDQSSLPTFNSHAIESCLHKIPELAENFIYMNDDFMLNQPCLPDRKSVV